MPKIKITLTKSVIKQAAPVKRTVTALGLTHVNRFVTVEDSVQIRGMVNQVKHLVSVQDAE